MNRDEVIGLRRTNFDLRAQLLAVQAEFLAQQRALNALQMEKVQTVQAQLAAEKEAFEADVLRNVSVAAS